MCPINNEEDTVCTFCLNFKGAEHQREGCDWVGVSLRNQESQVLRESPPNGGGMTAYPGGLSWTPTPCPPPAETGFHRLLVALSQGLWPKCL